MRENKSKTATLIVAWQDQNSRDYFPVARLVVSDESNGPSYEFCYLNGFRDAEKVGLQPFIAFPNSDKVYNANTLFPLFQNRLMPKSRPGFKEFVNRVDLGIDAADVEILARTGGRRNTDSLELFPVPNRDDNGVYVTHCLAHGIRYLPPQTLEVIDSLNKGDKLYMMADFQNQYDPLAIAFRDKDRHIVGYLPRYILPDLWKLISECNFIEITVSKVNEGRVPNYLKLLCRIESCWSSDFKPFCEDAYKPVSPLALKLDC